MNILIFVLIKIIGDHRFCFLFLEMIGACIDLADITEIFGIFIRVNLLRELLYCILILDNFVLLN